MRAHSKFFFTAITVILGACSTPPHHPAELPIGYHNAHYNFTFYLPATWKGYSATLSQWQTDANLVANGARAESGTIIIIRHPRWTDSDPYQDIPIVVFTRGQWTALKTGGLWPNAYAGGIMDEMWHNDLYVFALNSRYTWGELKSWEEVRRVVAQNLPPDPQHLYPE